MKIIKEFVLREIAGEYVLVPTGDTAQEFNGMITMNDTAKYMWEQIEVVESFEQLVEKVVDEYEVDQTIAERDAYSLISALVEHGFIECTKTDKSW